MYVTFPSGGVGQGERTYQTVRRVGSVLKFKTTSRFNRPHTLRSLTRPSHFPPPP